MHRRILKLLPHPRHHSLHLPHLPAQQARKQRLMERLQALHHLQIVPRTHLFQLLVLRPRSDGHGQSFRVDVFEAGGFHPIREVRTGRRLDAVGAVGAEAGDVGFLGGGVVEGVVRGGPFEVKVDEFGVAAWLGMSMMGF